MTKKEVIEHEEEKEPNPAGKERWWEAQDKDEAWIAQFTEPEYPYK